MTSLTRNNPRPSVLLLGLASGLSPLGVTIIVPNLATLAQDFNADFGLVQFMVSAYLLGLGVAQPFHGFLCDLIGRRPVMLAGFAIFVGASFACVFATDLNQLIIMRFFQAVGVSVGTVASRAVVRDTRGARGTAQALAYIAAAQGFSPIFAPMMGGWLGDLGGIRLIFAVTGVLGAATFLSMYFFLPETLDADHKRPRWRDWMGNYIKLFSTPAFVGYTLIFGFVQGSFFSFLAVGASIFENYFNMGPREFGTLWGLMAITYVLGATASARLTMIRGPDELLKIGVFVTMLGGWLMLILTTVFGINMITILLPMTLLMSVAGLVTPGALAGAVNSRPDIAGTSSGLSSAVGIVLGGSFTVIAGFIYDGSFEPIAILIAVAATLTAVSWLLVRQVTTVDDSAN